ncbi:hypothetical protein [Rhizohabitans arisaemae]|nr:hypothetical protein [Rhizohabitans arisaemae]
MHDHRPTRRVWPTLLLIAFVAFVLLRPENAATFVNHTGHALTTFINNL